MNAERIIKARSKKPEIEPNQSWVGLANGRVLRRLRILAPHPDGGWIYEEQAVDGKMLERRISVCPEFNLRYVFELEEK